MASISKRSSEARFLLDSEVDSVKRSPSPRFTGESGIKGYKRHACLVARQLGYDVSIISRIKAAKTAAEIEQALVTGRQAMR